MNSTLGRMIFTLLFGAHVWVAPCVVHGDGGAVGTWNSEMDLQGNLINVTITITDVDGKLAGKWSSPRGESDLSNIAYEGNQLTFSRTMNRDGQEFTLDFSGTVDGDKLDGTLSSAMGEIPLTGTRAAAATLTASTASGGVAKLVGTWDVTSESQLGTLKRTLIIEEDGEGSYNSDTDHWPINNLKVEGDKVSYNVTVSAQGQDLPLTFNGTLNGESLNGEYTSQAGNGTVVAKRRQAVVGGTGALTGTWHITSESQLGSLQRKLVVKEDGSATYNTDSESFEVKNLKLDGSNVTFDVTVSLQGQDLPLSFVGGLDGTNLKGVFNSDGNEVAQVVGVKAI